MIWLASFPRSGNTFFRIVLHEVYGVESSTFHQEATYPVDPNYNQYAVVKTHLLPRQLIPADLKIPSVYLVRDGRDALVSMARHRSDLIAPGSDYQSNLRDAILAAEGSFFGGWSRNVFEWLERASVVIRFEDLIRNPIECVERIRPFLDLPDPKFENLPNFKDLKTREMKYGSGLRHGFSEQERNHRREKFFRRGKIGAWKDEMPDELHSLFWRLHGEAMKKLGYERNQTAGERWNHGFQWRYSKVKRMVTRVVRRNPSVSTPVSLPENRRKTVLVLAYAQGMNGTAVHQRSFVKLFSLLPEYDFTVLTNPRDLAKRNYDLYLNLMPPYNVSEGSQAEGDFYFYTTDWLKKSLWLPAKKAYHILPKRFRQRIRPLKQWSFKQWIGLLPPPETWVTLCHDLTPVICPEWFSFPADWKIDFVSNYQKSKHIIVVSENTKQDLISQGVEGQDISVVYNTYDPDFNLHNMGIKPPLQDYLLVVGSFEPRKNARHVYEAFLKIKSRYFGKLVFIGSDQWGEGEIYERIRKDNRCVIRQKVSKEELIGWYHGAKALVYASLYEGFGLPILEAIGCGIPVICSDNSGMLEAGEGYAEFVDPKDSNDIAEKILKVISPDYSINCQAREHLLDQFSVKKNAKRLKETLDRVCRQKSELMKVCSSRSMISV